MLDCFCDGLGIEKFKILGHTFLCMASLQPALQLHPVLLELLHLGLQLLTPPPPLLLLLLQLLLERRWETDFKTMTRSDVIVLCVVKISWVCRNLASAKWFVSKRVCHFVVKSNYRCFVEWCWNSENHTASFTFSAINNTLICRATVLWYYNLKCKRLNMLRDKHYKKRFHRMKNWQQCRSYSAKQIFCLDFSRIKAFQNK